MFQEQNGQEYIQVPKNVNGINNVLLNPFNIGNNIMKINNQIKEANVYNQNNEENSLKLNINANNEIQREKSSLGNIIDITKNNSEIKESPIYENEGGNSSFIGQNSNDYKIIEQLLDNKKSNDKDIQKNNLHNINNNKSIISHHLINENVNTVCSIPNNLNNNYISNFTIKNSISEDIKTKLGNITLEEMNPSWFQEESNFNDPFYFEKLKQYELKRMGIKQLQLSDFVIGKKLGSGQFGHVYLAKLKSTQFICAIKVINKNRLLKESIKCINQVRREIEIQSHLHHPNILSLYSFFWDNKNIYLVIEYAIGGELYKILKNEKNGRFSEPRAAFYVEQVCNAIEYVHKMNVIHRDIKPENILLSNEIIKLADFGWSIHQKSNKLRTTFCGTAEYLPPEVIDDKPHIPSSDIWCLGILIYELCSGEPPFTSENDYETMKRIKYFKMRDYPQHFSEECKDLIGKLVKRNPKERISLEEVKKHPWLVNNAKKYKSNLISN